VNRNATFSARSWRKIAGNCSSGPFVLSIPAHAGLLPVRRSPLPVLPTWLPVLPTPLSIRGRRFRSAILLSGRPTILRPRSRGFRPADEPSKPTIQASGRRRTLRTLPSWVSVRRRPFLSGDLHFRFFQPFFVSGRRHFQFSDDASSPSDIPPARHPRLRNRSHSLRRAAHVVRAKTIGLARAAHFTTPPERLPIAAHRLPLTAYRLSLIAARNDDPQTHPASARPYRCKPCES
jgi:hypothetical protein